MAILETFEKQPADVQDYDFRFRKYIEGMGESVDDDHDIEVEVDDGITLDSSSIAAGVAKVWLSGGTSGQKYTVTCRILTAGGRTHEQEIDIKVKEIS